MFRLRLSEPIERPVPMALERTVGLGAVASGKGAYAVQI